MNMRIQRTRPLAYGVVAAAVLLTTGCAQLQSFQNRSDQALRGTQHIISVARLAERRGDVDQAKDVYQRLIEKGEATGVSYHRLGVIAARQSDLNKAIEHFEAARSAGNETVDLDIDVAYANLLLGREKSADAMLNNALRKEPGNKRALNNLAILRAKQGDIDECLALSRRVVGPAQAHSNVGYLLSQFGDMKDASNSFHKALNQDPELDVAARALLAIDKRNAGLNPSRNRSSHNAASRSMDTRPAPANVPVATSRHREDYLAGNRIAQTSTVSALEQARALHIDAGDPTTEPAIPTIDRRSTMERARDMDFDSIATNQTKVPNSGIASLGTRPRATTATRPEIPTGTPPGTGTLASDILPARTRTPIASSQPRRISSTQSPLMSRQLRTTLEPEPRAAFDPVVTAPLPAKFQSRPAAAKPTPIATNGSRPSSPAPSQTTNSPKRASAAPSRKSLMPAPLELAVFNSDSQKSGQAVEEASGQTTSLERPISSERSSGDSKAVLLSKQPVRLNDSRARAKLAARQLGGFMRSAKYVDSGKSGQSPKTMQATTGSGASRKSVKPLPEVWESQPRTPETP